MARRHRLPSSYRYKRAALGRDDAAAAMRPVQRPRVRRADRAPLMFVDCISVASVVVEAASRPRHLRAWQMQKAAAAYRSCIPQARAATTNRMKWELITSVSPARRTDCVLLLQRPVNHRTTSVSSTRHASARRVPPRSCAHESRRLQRRDARPHPAPPCVLPPLRLGASRCARTFV